MPVFKIHHVTKYNYERPVSESINEIRIFPYECSGQRVLSQELFISGNPDIQYFTDYWGNKTGIFNILNLHDHLTIDSRLVIETTSSSEIQLDYTKTICNIPEEIQNNLRLHELSTADAIKNKDAIDSIIQTISQDNKSIAGIAERCSAYIFKNFRYVKGITDIETTVDEILEHKAGVCQDFAHLMLHILKSLKIPCRYVSGYICPNKNGLRGEGATHAWVDVYIPGNGWVGIDPTNNLWVTNNHVILAVGRHFKDCTPMKGTFKGPAKQSLSVYVSVGYEDGHVFEEINDMKMEFLAAGKGDDSSLINLAGQQQQ